MLRSIFWICVAVPLWGGDVQFSAQFTPATPSLSDTIRVDVSITGDVDENLIIDAADVTPECVRVQSVSGSGARPDADAGSAAAWQLYASSVSYAMPAWTNGFLRGAVFRYRHSDRHAGCGPGEG